MAIKNNSKIILPKSLNIFPITVIVWGVMFPGIGLLSKWLNPNYIPNPAIICEAIPGELSGSILLIEVIILYIWKSLLIKTNNAIFLMGYGAFGIFSFGSIFFLITNVGIFCPPIAPNLNDLYTFLVLFFLFTAVIAFIFSIRTNTKKAIYMNSKKFDFDKMTFSINAPLTHISGKRISSIAIYVSSAGIFGLILSKSFGGYLNDESRLLSLVMVGTFITWYIWCYLLLSQLYTIKYVNAKCKALGKVMTIKEFSK